MGVQVPERFRVGDRVRVKWECTDGFFQPWRGRFEKGRVGTVTDGSERAQGRIPVQWDYRGKANPMHWRLAMHPGDLEKVES